MNIGTTQGQSYAQQHAQIEHNHNLVHQTAKKKEYDEPEAQIMALCIGTLLEYCNAQQYFIQKGNRIFRKKGEAAVLKEIKQLHDRTCFQPVSIAKMTPDEKRKAMLALMFLTQKRDGTIKACQVYNGKPTRKWLS